jgi:hypothetical protein
MVWACTCIGAVFLAMGLIIQSTTSGYAHPSREPVEAAWNLTLAACLNVSCLDPIKCTGRQSLATRYCRELCSSNCSTCDPVGLAVCDVTFQDYTAAEWASLPSPNYRAAAAAGIFTYFGMALLIVFGFLCICGFIINRK